MALLEAKNIRKVYATRFGGNQVQALTDVSFTVDEGEYVAIMGESGSGKTTLLNILAALDRPTSGTVLLDGKDISAIRENQLAHSGAISWGSSFRTSTCWTPSRSRTIFSCRWCCKA